MGATQSRNQDEALNLAVPKYTSFAGRRILDPGATRCSVCDSLFVPVLRKKHYCRRCGAIICEDCSAMRHYKHGGYWLFRVCRRCNSKPCILDLLVPGEKVWRLIMEFGGDLAQHRVLQVSRRTQLSYHLPYRWGLWEELFTDQHFLAKGANGAVFRTSLRPSVAREFDTPAAAGPVAVKVIQKNSIFSLRKWSHIQREMETLRLCRNPHVIELIGVFQSPDAVFIILEFAQGGDLFDWLVARRKPKEAEVRAIAVQLLGTVFLMHERFGVIHRDIKPENILLKNRCRGSEEPHLKFADFGFARRYPVSKTQLAAQTNANAALLAAVGSGSGSNASASLIGGVRMASKASGGGAVGSSLGAGGPESFDMNNLLLNATPCGTLGFAPPEVLQAYNARKADPARNEAAPETKIDVLKKMDIFALGVTLSILLTGQEPFPVNSSRAHMEAVQRGVNFNSRPWQYVSAAAKELIRRMLCAKAEDRPLALECLRSAWFEGTGAQEYIHQNPAELEEDVRTFQKSVRSLRHRPDMVYQQNKDGTGIAVANRAEAKAEEEDHIAQKTLVEDYDVAEQQHLAAAAASGSGGEGSSHPHAGSAGAAAAAAAASLPSSANATPNKGAPGARMLAGGASPSGRSDVGGGGASSAMSSTSQKLGQAAAGSGGGGGGGGPGAARRVAFDNSTPGAAKQLPPLAPSSRAGSQPQSQQQNPVSDTPSEHELQTPPAGHSIESS